MTCSYSIYIPYTVSEIQDRIKECYDKITLYSGMSDREKMKNGQDEYESGDVMSSLQKELSMWQNLLKEKQRQNEECNEPSNFTSKLYGC